jgi:FG-GAP-like repeat
VGDFNGDGHLDLVYAGQGGYPGPGGFVNFSGLLMLPGSGNGSFGAPIATNLTPEIAGSLAVADFNQDGIDDLAVAPSGVFWSGAEILLGTPTGQFTIANSEPLLGKPLSGTQVAAGDLDGDGYPDLVVADQGTITPYLNGSLVAFGSEFVELGTVSQGASSADQTVTISNAGDPPLHISSVEIVPVAEAPGNAPQDFAIDENGCSGQTLPAGAGQCRITVRFTPTGVGERDAALQINSNSPESRSFQILIGVGVGVGVGVAPPTNTMPPAISGSPAVGQTLSCMPGAWSGTAPKFAYQWLRDGSPIVGATGSTYTLAAADAGHTFVCQVTATNSAGSATTKSAPIGVPSLVATAGMTRASVKGASVSALLTCSGHPGASCNITLTLTVTETLKGTKLIAVSAAAKRTKAVRRTVTLGTRSLTLPAGQSETVHIKLNPTGLRLLTRRHSLRVKLIATQTSGTTTTIASSRIVSFKTSRKKR